MKDKKGRDTQVEFQSGATKKKRLATTPTPRPKGIGKNFANQPIRKPAFADSKVADAARRTNKAKREGEGLVRKGSQITRRKGADNYTLRVIDPTPKKQKTPAEKTFEKRPFKKKGPGEVKPNLRGLPGPAKPKKKPFSFRSPSGQDFGKDAVYRRPITKKKKKSKA